MNIGFIPLRKGSKGIPGKNHKLLLGRPLFSWVLYETVKSNLDKIYIYTDDEKVINYIREEYSNTIKIHVLQRSKESATDDASTEFAMWEFSEKINFNFDNIVLIQATSPLLDYKTINKCISSITSGFDSCLTVTPIKRFFWSRSGVPSNYNYLKRPRRQDFDFEYVENGACYCVKKETYLVNKNRLGGKINLIEMDDYSYTEIDEPSDFLIVEALLKEKLKHQGNLSNIRLLCLDVDGVLTDASSQYTNEGEFSKQFSLFDGKGLELIRNVGINVCVITSENSEIVKSRMNKLNIDDVFYGVKDKYYVLDTYLKRNNYLWDEVAYVGDDVNDLTNIISSGFSFCPQNASNIIKVNANIIVNKTGGFGAVREVCDIILKAVK